MPTSYGVYAMPETPKPLSDRRYAALLDDITRLLAAKAEDTALKRLHTYWAVGQRVQGEALPEVNSYKRSILRDLASDASLPLRTLNEALRFYELYPTLDAVEHLGWSHIRLLLPIASPKTRGFYENLVREQKLSARALAAAIDAGLANPKAPRPTLARPQGAAYLYSAEVAAIIDGDTLDVVVDLGFRVRQELRLRLAHIDAPESGTPDGRKAKTFVAKSLLKAVQIVVKTARTDLYGRYVADLFYSQTPCSIDACFERGRYLNDELLQAGHALKVRVN